MKVMIVVALLLPTSAHAEWQFLVAGKLKNAYPDTASSACWVDKASWKWVHPDDRTECRKIKGKGR